jgi:hypothetical protein
MKTRQILLIISIVLMSFSASVASAGMRGGGGMAMHSSGNRATVPATSRFTSASRFNHFNRFNRFNHFHNRTFVFVDAFGFPFFDPFFYGYYPYPYPYYGYYPYGYDGYGYGGGTDYGYGSDRSSVVALQRQLARAGYYHGSIDGIMGPQTRRAMRAYQRAHNMPA